MYTTRLKRLAVLGLCVMSLCGANALAAEKSQRAGLIETMDYIVKELAVLLQSETDGDGTASRDHRRRQTHALYELGDQANLLASHVGADDRALAPLIHLEQAAGATPDPVRRLAAIATPA